MKDLFYSNGSDIFGPVSFEEFSNNKYYKSTMIWYDGLTGWINIADCEELKHLIGTMSTPELDSIQPFSLPNLTPPLSNKAITKSGSKKKYLAFTLSVLIALIVSSLIFYNYNKKVNVSPPVTIQENTFKSTIIDSIVFDSTAIKQKAILELTRLETEMKTYRVNWKKFIMAVPNDFNKKELGGISDLKIIVKNNSPYKVDNLMVKVLYLKANGDIYHTEMITFDNIAPKSDKELFAPNSDRGVKVSCNILAIKSSSMNLCMDKNAKNFTRLTGVDPYKCN